LKLSFAHGIVCGMNYLHSQHPPVIHSDLKIENILVSDRLVAKVIVVIVSYVSIDSIEQTSRQAVTMPWDQPEIEKNKKKTWRKGRLYPRMEDAMR